MNKMLYKAKVDDNAGDIRDSPWVEGFYTEYFLDKGTLHNEAAIIDLKGKVYPVVKKTVSKFVNRIDKNKKYIFENDILEFFEAKEYMKSWSDGDCGEYGNEEVTLLREYLGVVRSLNSLGLVISIKKMSEEHIIDGEIVESYYNRDFGYFKIRNPHKNCKKVGNIYDWDNKGGLNEQQGNI